MKAILTVGMVLAAALVVGCGDDGGNGGGGEGGSAVSNDPGRDVEGCFDCADTEYCLVVSGETEEFHCAETDCAADCACMIDDGQSRLAVCQAYSCQEGGDILYCYDE
ncbi:MAG: hypothetical protein HOW73_13390 [Polyangiaceae bacterium]|nr:hypothetical protein [Polyangiaceae bacterium]